jgi:NAD(P) transhydrogenase subunit alpha
MILGVPRETFPGETRVAAIPSLMPTYKKLGIELLLEAGAGERAGFPDKVFTDKGARVAGSRDEVFQKADFVAQVRTAGANPEAGADDLPRLREGLAVFGFCEPLGDPERAEQLTRQGVALFAAELVPRITRAQNMDALSSMATIAGYKAVLMAASELPRMFPLMMTAAGTLAASNVLILGAGVAGLQAIATSRRLGAIVRAYDVRPAVKEQVLSLGAKFLELELETGDAQDAGGYAKALGEEFYKKQREMMLGAVGESDVVITTAAVPGKKAPILVTTEMVERMAPGSVIVDLAAERGGNCELTRAGETVVHNQVRIVGPVNIPASTPYHASEMYARNIANFLKLAVKEGKLSLETDDEVVNGTLVGKGGQVTHPQVISALEAVRGTAGHGKEQ